MKRIAFVLPHFGRLNHTGYFPLFLAGCAANPTVDFLFFTDDPTPFSWPANTHVTRLSFDALRERIQERQPSVFFSHELCARYFTYMSRESGAHFVLFDDGATLAQKLQVARSLEIRSVLAAWPEIADAAGELGLRRTVPNRAAR